MKVTALLSWFDERPEDLRRAVRSHAASGAVDSFIALDGRYALFGSGPCVSPDEQHDAIRDACREYGVGFTIARREDPWAGEVEKRGYLFRMALAQVTPETDWLWIVDADNELRAHPGADRIRAELMGTDRHAVAVTFAEPGRLIHETRRPMRQLFRALPGLTTYGRHWYYAAKVGGEWAYLWGPGEVQVPAHEFPEIVVAHYSRDRDPVRREDALAYYAARDARGVEVSPSWFMEDEWGALAAVDNEGELA